MNPLTCPQCAQVDQVQSVQSVYATQSGVTHGSSLAVGGALTGPMVARVESRGTLASNLALRLTPPPEPRRQSAAGCGVAFAVTGALGIAAVAFAGSRVTEGTDKTKSIAIVIGALCVIPIVIIGVIRRERTFKRQYKEYAAIWPAMMQVWQRAMACLRCHGVFFPPEVPTPGLSAEQLIPIDVFQAAVTDIGNRLLLASPEASDHKKPLPPAAS